MKLVEPPSCSPAAPGVFVGRNRRGNWIVREQNGVFGGVFVNRAHAFKYALRANGHHPETIVELPREIELYITASPQIISSRRMASQIQAIRECRVAALCYASKRANRQYHDCVHAGHPVWTVRSSSVAAMEIDLSRSGRIRSRRRARDTPCHATECQEEGEADEYSRDGLQTP
ncbi:hypothetical protein [Bradyrhizobium sacchari]|uniref:hypothetical protein n=1 Tax=Bradyrhizobium sacchari TaxID=1399419 RepID=UPI003221D6A9